MKKLLRINAGCGRCPTDGWLNIDNSVAIRLSRFPLLVEILRRMGALKSAQIENLEFLRNHRIIFGDVRKRIPALDGSADVVYTSHMVEHLDRAEVSMFLREVARVLDEGGIVRVVVPNMSWHIANYIKYRDCDILIEKTLLGRRLPKTFIERLKVFFLGEREYHVWMYDDASIIKLLENHGFVDAKCYPPGQTGIVAPGALNLSERAPESLYVEAIKGRS